MKTLTTQATINSFTNQGNENSIIHSAIAFINQIDFYNECLYRELVDKIQAALTEAIDNVVTFAYPNKQGKVCVSIFIYDKNVLKLNIKKLLSAVCCRYGISER